MSRPYAMSERMRDAADTLEQVNVRYGCDADYPWCPSELRKEADHVEAEEREAVEREGLIESLAKELLEGQCRQMPNRVDLKSWDTAGKQLRENCRVIARHLIESGWRKGDPS